MQPFDIIREAVKELRKETQLFECDIDYIIALMINPLYITQLCSIAKTINEKQDNVFVYGTKITTKQELKTHIKKIEDQMKGIYF
jgi:hypothetical protein